MGDLKTLKDLPNLQFNGKEDPSAMKATIGEYDEGHVMVPIDENLTIEKSVGILELKEAVNEWIRRLNEGHLAPESCGDLEVASELGASDVYYITEVLKHIFNLEGNDE